ncbi:MAG: sialate O-acetylesterase [Blastopirellula sp.]|nr:sialate O-acetylesterase [Blastopirellula sp.]
MLNRVRNALLLSMWITLPASLEAQTVKVFILSGQSNMEGKGNPLHLDTYKNDPLIQPSYASLKDGDQWKQRDDVWITYPSKSSGAKHGPLTVGYGTKGEDSIGPEFGFGHAVGDALDEPVLLIKVAWGGRSIHKPFRPPGALPTDEELKQMVADAQAKFQEQTKSYEAKKAAGKKARKPKPAPTFDELKVQFGDSYRKLIAHTKEELATFEEKFPALKGHRPEIAGFIWHQGFNDKIRSEYRETKYADYTKWLAQFIRDVRKDLDAPQMPFIIGELSTGGIPNRGDFQMAQANTAKLAEFQGRVVFVPTAEFYDTAAHELYVKGYWKGTEEQKAQWRAVGNDRPYHYLGSGKTYYLKGRAFGDAVLKVK